ncbi:MAG: hypothetical protein M1829_000620 [Trizodia sp. TS-e1964]|nr:MAG: hypothetical protein M1829_000620 [Trizodia sp. TS-e1964]
MDQTLVRKWLLDTPRPPKQRQGEGARREQPATAPCIDTAATYSPQNRGNINTSRTPASIGASNGFENSCENSLENSLENSFKNSFKNSFDKRARHGPRAPLSRPKAADARRMPHRTAEDGRPPLQPLRQALASARMHELSADIAKPYHHKRKKSHSLELYSHVRGGLPDLVFPRMESLRTLRSRADHIAKPRAVKRNLHSRAIGQVLPHSPSRRRLIEHRSRTYSPNQHLFTASCTTPSSPKHRNATPPLPTSATSIQARSQPSTNASPVAGAGNGDSLDPLHIDFRRANIDRLIATQNTQHSSVGPAKGPINIHIARAEPLFRASSGNAVQNDFSMPTHQSQKSPFDIKAAVSLQDTTRLEATAEHEALPTKVLDESAALESQTAKTQTEVDICVRQIMDIMESCQLPAHAHPLPGPSFLPTQYASAREKLEFLAAVIGECLSCFSEGDSSHLPAAEKEFSPERHDEMPTLNLDSPRRDQPNASHHQIYLTGQDSALAAPIGITPNADHNLNLPKQVSPNLYSHLPGRLKPTIISSNSSPSQRQSLRSTDQNFPLPSQHNINDWDGKHRSRTLSLPFRRLVGKDTLENPLSSLNYTALDDTYPFFDTKDSTRQELSRSGTLQIPSQYGLKPKPGSEIPRYPKAGSETSRFLHSSVYPRKLHSTEFTGPISNIEKENPVMSQYYSADNVLQTKFDYSQAPFGPYPANFWSPSKVFK